jgi:hypothetical protein
MLIIKQNYRIAKMTLGTLKHVCNMVKSTKTDNRDVVVIPLSIYIAHHDSNGGKFDV